VIKNPTPDEILAMAEDLALRTRALAMGPYRPRLEEAVAAIEEEAQLETRRGGVATPAPQKSKQEELVVLFRQCRNAQIAYFQLRTTDNLKKAKELERQVDAALSYQEGLFK
jgi:outer membrane scaffolding protein for murein synthesis (MipA/OmpV family)